MSKFSYLLTLLLCLTLPAHALDQRFSLGLMAGIMAGAGAGDQIDMLYDSQGKQVPGALSNNLIGGQLTLFAQYRLPEVFFGLQAEAAFLFNRGISYSDPVNHEFDTQISGNGVAVNLLVQGIITTTEVISFSIFVGPSFTFPLGGINQTLYNKKTGVIDRISFTPTAVTYGIIAGLGLQMELGPGFFLVDGRFQMDFTPFSAERHVSLNTPFALQLGYSFYLFREKL